MIQSRFQHIISKSKLHRNDIIEILQTDSTKENELLQNYAYKIKVQNVQNIAYLRGLIEYSNMCGKNCLYCGIRSQNAEISRYTLSDKEVFDAVDFAWKNKYGSIVIQAGEMQSLEYTDHITKLIAEIKKRTNNEIGITLSLGEQNEQTYRDWFNAGAHRYLLRIETSNRALFKAIHPQNSHHSFDTRVNCLQSLKEIGYQVGTGVMIGLPYQTFEHLADDLVFLKEFNVDMVGLGPYIEHSQTPLYNYKEILLAQQERFRLTLRMIALLRIMMKDINIVSATALQTLDLMGREKGLQYGANIIMPNITPSKYRNKYLLYENKSCIEDSAEECKNCLDMRLSLINEKIGYIEWGDSKHFFKKSIIK